VPVTPANSASLGGAAEQLELRVAPTEQPHVWMIPDSIGPIPGASPVVYHLMALNVDLVRPGVNGAADETLAEMELDFLAPAIGISLNNQGEDFLDIGLGGTFVDLKILNSNVPTCPRKPHIAGHALTCEGLAEALFETLMRPALVDVMHELLSEVPWPHRFDANGAATPCGLNDLSTYQGAQRVTIYADLVC